MLALTALTSLGWMILGLYMIFNGLYALIAGKLTFFKNKLENGNARTAGLLFLLPIPGIIAFGTILSVLDFRIWDKSPFLFSFSLLAIEAACLWLVISYTKKNKAATA